MPAFGLALFYLQDWLFTIYGKEMWSYVICHASMLLHGERITYFVIGVLTIFTDFGVDDIRPATILVEQIQTIAKMLFENNVRATK